MISVIMPVYNEEGSIKVSIKEVSDFLSNNRGRLGNYEIIIVDDGSSDHTVGAVKSLNKTIRNLRLVKHQNNMGVGAALRTGLKAARGDLIITTDSDLTYAPEDIIKLIDKMKDTGADIVIGTPLVKGGDASQIPFVRKALSIGANTLDAVVFGLNFSTPTCIFRSWKREAAKAVRITFDRFEGVSESAIDASRKGFKIVNVGVKYRAKAGRKSKMDVLNTIRRHLTFIYTLKRGSRK